MREYQTRTDGQSRTGGLLALRERTNETNSTPMNRLDHVAASISSRSTSEHVSLLNRMTASRSLDAQNSILQLQRSYGNRYVQRAFALARQEGGESEVTPEVQSAIEGARGGGQGLDHGVRRQMDSAFGADFSGVRIHTGAEAHSLNRAVNAIAFTTGQDIFFRDGAYSPETSGGKELLAHELTHVVQQCETTGVQGKLTVGSTDDHYEQEADRVAKTVVSTLDLRPAATTQSFGSDAPPVQRQCVCGGHKESGGECQECRRKGEGSAQRALLQRQGDDDVDGDGDGGTDGDTTTALTTPGCTPGAGIPNSTCAAYSANSWWLPLAYVDNATCACSTTPNLPEYNCIRKFLQDRLASAPTALKSAAAAQKSLESSWNPLDWIQYKAWVVANLTPVIYRDHVDAYSACCCPSGPAAYPSWIGVTTIPMELCALVAASIAAFGSCHGTPGRW